MRECADSSVLLTDFRSQRSTNEYTLSIIMCVFDLHAFSDLGIDKRDHSLNVSAIASDVIFIYLLSVP